MVIDTVMSFLHVNNEMLREYATSGDAECIKKLLDAGEVNIDNQSQINGMTALHWACLRGHLEVVRLLLIAGADTTVVQRNNLLPMQLTEDPEIQCLLDKSHVLREQGRQANPGAGPSGTAQQTSSTGTSTTAEPSNETPTNNGAATAAPPVDRPASPMGAAAATGDDTSDVITIRVRKGAVDEDFYEMELPKRQLLYKTLLSVVSFEFDIDPEKIVKIRKLPNTLIRKDQDVQRFVDGQELEIFLNHP